MTTIEIDARDENDALQAAWSALGFTDPDDAEAALFAAGWQAGRDWARAEANARLIGGAIGPDTFEAALAAIAKAQGEQP
jgi:hypothetical protein